VLDSNTGRLVSFIVGDLGGRLSEGSARLLAQLRGIENLPTATKVNAFGMAVDRLQGEMAGDFRVVVFRHSALLLPTEQRRNLSVLGISSATLVDWITNTAANRLREIGGIDQVRVCSDE
jgi:hypothetical protein